MSSSFPLLHLPGVVLWEIFKSLSIGEKIQLSLCSKKVSIQINSARLYSQKVIVDLDFLYQKIRVHSENNRDIFDIFIFPNSGMISDSNMQQFSIECCTVRVFSIPMGIKLFWKNYPKGFLPVIQHLLKMLQCKISTEIDCYFSDLFEPTISKLFDLQQEFKTLTIKGQNLQIFNNLRLVEDLTISSSFDPGFKPVFTSWPQEINIWSSAWFTLEYLFTCTSTRIILDDSSLGNKDLDVILNEWKAGRLPNLEYLYVKSQRISDNGPTILGMNLLELLGKDIQTNDGSKKLVTKLVSQFGYERIEMSVTVF
ncbi:hypothetical protein GCK72_003141 [Caenorhabditis remanei]|uniref:F-box domain-containing protein n=1 Tax=Caenorhabditis remanei TaxID=31234 RepID=A0A6A5HUM1_CAERE|nr:hypothetical protein GCK72_003141 [Caenorhabditis remanei]KAF1771315.1 hypothetical protein GCK72_003141 [Caenorhabditis remanei]